MENCQKFEGKFGKFGKEWELIDDLFSHLEFIWAFHGYTEKDVDSLMVTILRLSYKIQ